MRHAHLLLSQNAGVPTLIESMSHVHSLDVTRILDGYALLSAAGEQRMAIRQTRFGWMSSVDLKWDASIAVDVARRVPVRLLRLFWANDSSRAVALYSWWGPDSNVKESRCERTDDRIGLSVRAVYRRTEFGEASDEPWKAGKTLVETLTADVSPSPRAGWVLPASRIAQFLAQVDRALLQAQPGMEPLDTLLAEIQHSGPNPESVRGHGR